MKQINDLDAVINAQSVVRKLSGWIDRRLQSANDILTEAAGRSLSDSQYRSMKSAVDQAAEYATLVERVQRTEETHRRALQPRPRVYGAGSPYSYFRDLALAMTEHRVPGCAEAAERLRRHHEEVHFEVRIGTAEGRRALAQVRELNREVVRPVAEQRVNEYRAGTSTSIGGFTTPAYIVEQWVAYHSPFRAVASQCQPFPMPDYGLEVHVPSFASAATAGIQTVEGTGMYDSSPADAGVTATIVPIGGQVELSQQLFDRGGAPGIEMDEIIAAALRESYDAAVDSYVISQILAASGLTTVTDNSGPLTVSKLWADVSKARAATMDAGGVRRPATHLFLSADVNGWLSEQVDATTNRPLFVPSYTQQPYARLAAAGDPLAESWTGHEIQGLATFLDLSIPNSGSNVQLIVGRAAEVLLAEGPMMVRAFPQTDAPNLTVVVQAYAYVVALVRRPGAFSVVTGTAYPTSLAA